MAANEGKLNTLGGRIKHARVLLKLSLNELAQAAGVSKGYLFELEAGTLHNPTLEMLLKLCAILGVSVEELATGCRLRGSQEAQAEVFRLRAVIAQVRLLLNQEAPEDVST